ncbi:hypothetical protein NMD75_04135 [Edwardsiella tarda]
MAAFGVMMNKVDKRALREAAVSAKTAGDTQDYYRQTNALNAFMGRTSPDVVIALLDENEALAAENERLKQSANEMQAQGVEMFANSLRLKGDDRFFDELADATADVADLFARNLREPKA